MHNGLTRQLRAEPHPYLNVGGRVRIVYGPLADLEGILVRKKRGTGVVLSTDLIQRSIIFEVDPVNVGPSS